MRNRPEGTIGIGGKLLFAAVGIAALLTFALLTYMFVHRPSAPVRGETAAPGQVDAPSPSTIPPQR